MDITGTGSGQEAVEARSEVKERRIAPRARCWGTAAINILPDGIMVIGYLIDLGLGGCYIEADDAIPVHVDTRVDVLMDIGGVKLRLAGVILRMEGETRAGIGFTDLSLRKVEQIHQLMAAIIAAEKERLAGVEELGG
jgi:hypothetical protein